MLKLSSLFCTLAFAIGLSSPLWAQDTTPPSAGVVAPADGSYVNSLLSLGGTAADDTAVSEAQLRLIRLSDGYSWDGAAFISAETWLAAAFADPAWSYVSLPAWADGESYSVIARSSDTSANLSAVYSTSVFHFDAGLPVSAVTAPAGGSFTSTFTGVSGTAWDGGSFVSQVRVKLVRLADGKYWDAGVPQWATSETWNLAAGSATWTWAGPPQAGLISGATYFAVSRAYDLAGNIQVSEIAGSTFVYSGFPLPPGCAQAVSVKNSGLGDYTFIQDALDALPRNLAGDTCVLVTDDGSYTEEVRVEGFTNNGYRLKIMAVPGTTVTVSPPPASTAGFLLFNSSVTVAGMEVIPGGSMPYGILASSDSVILSSVSVVSAGSISGAGISISSGGEVSDSAVVVEDAAGIVVGGGANNLARDSVTNASPLYNALFLEGGSYNTVTGGIFFNDAGRAVELGNGASHNTISNSTVTAGSSEPALRFFMASSNTVTNSYLQSFSTAAYVQGSTNTVISGSALATTGAGGAGLYLCDGSSGLSLTAGTVSGGASGAAIFLGPDNSGPLSISSVAITGGAYGFNIAPQSAVTALDFSGITFQGLAAGATAVNFTGGAPVSTFTGFGFNDAGLGVNVNGSLLVPGSRITMLGYSGARAGQAYETDPASYVDWYVADISSPSVAILNPADLSYLNSLPAITGTAADNIAVSSAAVSLMDQAGLYWDGSAWGAGQAWLPASVWASSWTYSPVPAWADSSSYTVTARAWDASGNWTGAVSVFSYDVTPPAAVITGPPAAVSSTFTFVSGTASDPAGVAQVQVSVRRQGDNWYWDGSGWDPAPAWNLAAGTTAWLYASISSAALDSGSTYFFTLRAYDTAGNISDPALGSSTFTYVIPPEGELGASAFSIIGSSSLAVNWTTTYPAGKMYYVRLATQAAPSPYLYSGSSFSASLLFPGLTPDSFYYGFVSTSPASGFSASGSGRTLAAAPGAVSFGSVGYSSASLSWGNGGNPAWTVYGYELSESPAFAVLTSSSSGAVLGAVLTGLAQGTTYYARVRAANADGFPTAYVNAGAPAVTRVLLPAGAASALSGAALGVSSISWTWASGSLSAATSFSLYSAPGVLLATAPFAASASFTQGGLGANTAHVLRVAGGNENGESPLAVSSTVYTLAQVPDYPAAQVALSSAVIALGLNGNAAGTPLQLWRSEDNLFFTNLYEGPALSYLDAGLGECSAHYYKARARNGAGFYSGFSGTLSFTTLASTPAAPGGLSAEALDGSRIALAWEPSPSASVSHYSVYYDSATGLVDYAAPLAVLAPAITSWTTPALAAGSTYKFAVRASGACGTEEKNTALLASAQAVGLLSGVRAAIKVPQTGKRIKGNMVTVVAEIILGLPSQVAQVRFQYSPAGAGAWADIPSANINHPNPDLSAPYFVHLNADALAAGAYELRAVATDIYGAADTASPSVTVEIGAADYDINETVTAGEQSKEQKINNAVTSTVQAADDSTALITKVIIPSGAVTDSTASVTLVNNPAYVPPPPAGADSLSLSLKVNLSNGQSQLAGGKTAALTFTYKDDDGNGIVDGSLAAVDRLRVYSVSDSGGVWAQLETSVDKEKKTVTASTTHFSFFSVFASAASGLGAVKIYPVPWQPGAGGRFDAAGVTFSGLPASARIKIFTITGELVRLLEVSAADAGFKVWDGKNSEGYKAASGVYLAVVKAGSDERTLKMAVER